jgi:tetratricopeptide (TPR) repeat protein
MLEDPRALRWEIANACVIQDWVQALLLIDRLRSLGAITVPECRALKGQVQVCSVVAPRSEAEDEGEEGQVGKDFPGWWVPKMDRAYFPGGDFGSWIRPLGLLAWGMKLTGDAEYSAGECERLSDAAHEWDVCFEENSDLLSSYRAAWGKCHFLGGDYLRAAKQFDRLLACGCGLPSEMEVALRPNFYLNAAECFGKGGETEAAVRHLEECAQEFPRTKGLWLRLAKLYLSSPLDLDLQKVQECLRKEEEIDPTFGDDPRTSVAFTLAELGGPGLRATLRKVAESNPGDLQVMNALVSRHWAGFQSLDEDSRRLWVGAAAFLWGPSPLGPVLRRKVAAVFADIAEGQLRRIFERFRQENGPTVLQGISSASGKDKLVKFLEGSHLGLGDMIYEIEATRRPVPVHPDLKSWLQRHAHRMTQSWDPSRAWRLNDLRRLSSHGGEISERESLELYDLSVWLVTQLTSN